MAVGIEEVKVATEDKVATEEGKAIEDKVAIEVKVAEETEVAKVVVEAATTENETIVVVATNSVHRFQLNNNIGFQSQIFILLHFFFSHYLSLYNKYQ